MAPSIKTSFAQDVSVIRIALLDSFIKVTKIGKTTGKLSIAIIVAELLALAAIAETKVKVILKVGDRVRMLDGKSVGTIDKIEKDKAVVNYGVFTSKVSLEALEFVQAK